MVAHFTLATAKAYSANRPDLAPYRGMKSSESGAPDAIPSLTNSDPSSWIQEAGHQGARALASRAWDPSTQPLAPEVPLRTSGPLRPPTSQARVLMANNPPSRPLRARPMLPVLSRCATCAEMRSLKTAPFPQGTGSTSRLFCLDHLHFAICPGSPAPPALLLRFSPGDSHQLGLPT